ncbi:MAG TPA: hypothetical protein VG317_05040 [Pseudonocardiaceae bacterium]|jgi:hypothetical protein|nr:hypothetical protein [Pseudonocardiaceae bacterium]
MSRLLDANSQAGIAPEFTVSAAMLDTVSPSGDRGGMVIGSGMQNEPLSMAVVRPAPTRVFSVGGLYLARQLALRAMAIGAWVVIATARPAAWQVLVRAAGQLANGRPAPSVQIRRLNPIELPRATEEGPLLVLHDGGSTPQELFPPRSAWQTTVYVLPYLHPQVTQMATSADLCLLQRQPLGQAQLASRIWRLHPQAAQQLTTLKDDQVMALGRGLFRPFRLITTAREQQILGPIRRGD